MLYPKPENYLNCPYFESWYDYLTGTEAEKESNSKEIGLCHLHDEKRCNSIHHVCLMPYCPECGYKEYVKKYREDMHVCTDCHVVFEIKK